jgi:isoaspartyl peptidase/L-asparaginase-like protein (Ntn-hydrolase superfamily)
VQTIRNPKLQLTLYRRVGDAAVPGAGAYVDDTVGGAAATGDGDVMMRLLPTFHAVQDMKAGVHVSTRLVWLCDKLIPNLIWCFCVASKSL